MTALTFRKDAIFKGKETKQEQIEMLEDLQLPDNVIAIIIGSTIDSVQASRSQRKAKAKKVPETGAAGSTNEHEANKQ